MKNKSLFQHADGPRGQMHFDPPFNALCYESVLFETELKEQWVIKMKCWCRGKGNHPSLQQTIMMVIPLTLFVRNCRTKLTYRKRSIMIEHKCFSRLLWFSMSVTLSVSFWILLLLYSLSYPGEGHLSHTGLWLIPCICRTCGLQMAGREPSFFFI